MTTACMGLSDSSRDPAARLVTGRRPWQNQRKRVHSRHRVPMTNTLPLSSYTVPDLTIARTGPAAVRLLAELGCDRASIDELRREGAIA